MVLTTYRVMGHGRKTQEPHHFVNVTDGDIILSFIHDGGRSLQTGKAASAEFTNGRTYTNESGSWRALPRCGDGITDQADIEAINHLHEEALKLPVAYIGWDIPHSFLF